MEKLVKVVRECQVENPDADGSESSRNPDHAQRPFETSLGPLDSTDHACIEIGASCHVPARARVNNGKLRVRHSFIDTDGFSGTAIPREQFGSFESCLDHGFLEPGRV